MHKTFRPAVTQGDPTIVQTAHLRKAIAHLSAKGGAVPEQPLRGNPYTAWTGAPPPSK